MAKPLVWRIGVAAIGLAVAVAVGWRLSSDVTVLVVACAWVPLAAWCLFAPRSAAALPVALVLLAAIGTIWWALPGQPGDRTLSVAWSVLVWYPLAGGLALLTATWWSRGRRTRPLWMVIGGPSRPPGDPAAGDARPLWLRLTATLVATGVLVFGCCLGGLGPGMPSPDELFPLPVGMDATRDSGPDGPDGCDQTGHACWTYYRITGAAGESAAVLTERLRRHLREAKGWSGSEECRPVRGFVLLAATELCITVISDPADSVDHPAIGVELSMSDIRSTA
ncbi:hypothetical protein AB0M46_26615 [Dactylosporangium sp. NPDC051485]|uniref:hypothetical protein n=1 Tax=Dactylosporangium sp. NPDC051485 TaxID=3154846 RepID=UPI0034443C32